MRIHRLSIRNFRGIKTLDWNPPAGLNCLVGPGDSTKTAILDAISLLLAHRWNLAFSDADFYLGEPSNEIQIEATIVDLPDEVFSHAIFGERLRGVRADGTEVDDPIDGADPAVTVRLDIDANLEPRWSVIKDANEEPRPLSASQRESFGVQRLDDTARQHLGWSRSSALSRLTGNSGDLPLTLANAQRAARTAIFANPDPALVAAAISAQEAAKLSGAPVLSDVRPGLDPSLQLRSGSLVLHEGALPLESYGLGSRRLLSLAVQREAVGNAGLLLLDEIELGLEPHRLRHLLNRLRSDAAQGKQVFLTTHSPITLENLEVSALRIVRSVGGSTSVKVVPDELGSESRTWQAIARSAPSALLAERVVVGEGSTEVGFCWGLIEKFDQASDIPAAARGVTVMNGKDGLDAPKRALRLRELDYGVALMIDNDGGSNASDVTNAVRSGSKLIQWSSGCCLEQQLFFDVPLEELSGLLQLAVELNDTEDPEQSVQTAVTNQLPGVTLAPGLDVEGWIAAHGQSVIRSALGRASVKAKWFKSESKGYRLGRFISGCSEQIVDGPVHDGLAVLQAFTHGNGDE